MLKSFHTWILVLTTSLTQCIKLFLNLSKVLLSYQLVYKQMKALKIASKFFFFLPLKCPATKTLGVSCTTHRTIDLRVRRILQRSSGQSPAFMQKRVHYPISQMGQVRPRKLKWSELSHIQVSTQTCRAFKYWLSRNLFLLIVHLGDFRQPEFSLQVLAHQSLSKEGWDPIISGLRL